MDGTDQSSADKLSLLVPHECNNWDLSACFYNAFTRRLTKRPVRSQNRLAEGQY